MSLYNRYFEKIRNHINKLNKSELEIDNIPTLVLNLSEMFPFEKIEFNSEPILKSFILPYNGLPDGISLNCNVNFKGTIGAVSAKFEIVNGIESVKEIIKDEIIIKDPQYQNIIEFSVFETYLYFQHINWCGQSDIEVTKNISSIFDQFHAIIEGIMKSLDLYSNLDANVRKYVKDRLEYIQKTGK